MVVGAAVAAVVGTGGWSSGASDRDASSSRSAGAGPAPARVRKEGNSKLHMRQLPSSCPVTMIQLGSPAPPEAKATEVIGDIPEGDEDGRQTDGLVMATMAMTVKTVLIMVAMLVWRWQPGRVCWSVNA